MCIQVPSLCSHLSTGHHPCTACRGCSHSYWLEDCWFERLIHRISDPPMELLPLSTATARCYPTQTSAHVDTTTFTHHAQKVCWVNAIRIGLPAPGFHLKTWLQVYGPAGVPDFLCVSSTRVSVLVAVKRSVYPLCSVAQLFVPLDFRPTAEVLALIVDPGVAVQLPQQCIAVVRWFASTWQGYLPNLKVGFERLKKHRIFGGAGNGY